MNTTKKTKTGAAKGLVRLDANAQQGRLSVDRTFPGRISNVSLVTTGPALGHGFEVDRTTVEQVARFGGGIRGRWTHGNLSDDGLARHLGAWEQLRALPFRCCRACELEADGTACASCGEPTTVEWRAVGTFVFAASAHTLKPDGLDVPAPVYLMDRAEEDPKSLGISIVARFGFVEDEVAVAPTDEAPAAEDGQASRGGESDVVEDDDQRPPPRRLARLEAKADLKRGDWVADPAANPVGLSEPAPLHAGTSTPSELTEAATRTLDRIVAKEGRLKAQLRAIGFLARYFGDESDDAPTAASSESAELAALRAEVEALKSERATRDLAEQEAFLRGLREASAAAQSPIANEDMERVAALWRDGHVESAKAMGELLLARSSTKGQTAYKRGGSLPLSPPAPADPKDRAVEVATRLLKSRGWRVELDASGKAIQRAEPPSAQSRKS